MAAAIGAGHATADAVSQVLSNALAKGGPEKVVPELIDILGEPE